MITNCNEAKTWVQYILCDCKCIFNSTTWNSNKKWNNETCRCECKIYRTCKKDHSCNHRSCICENRKYLKCIAETWVTAFDEIIYVMDIVSTKITNTIATNMWINCHDKKVRYKLDCYILHRVLLVIILLLITTIICYHYASHRSKQKGIYG